MLYRIFTEDKNEKELEELLTKHYPGFTVIKAEGFWRLQKEHSLIIEIVTEDFSSVNAEKFQDNAISEIAREIKELNKQEAVLIQKIRNTQWMV